MAGESPEARFQFVWQFCAVTKIYARKCLRLPNARRCSKPKRREIVFRSPTCPPASALDPTRTNIIPNKDARQQQRQPPPRPCEHRVLRYIQGSPAAVTGEGAAAGRCRSGRHWEQHALTHCPGSLGKHGWAAQGAACTHAVSHTLPWVRGGSDSNMLCLAGRGSRSGWVGA